MPRSVTLPSVRAQVNRPRREADPPSGRASRDSRVRQYEVEATSVRGVTYAWIAATIHYQQGHYPDTR